MLLPTYINVNRGGIPAISSLSVNVTTTEVQFDFNNHRNIGTPFRGLLIVRLNQAIPTGTTTTLPVVFTSSGGNPQRLTGFNGADITVAQISGTGIYLCWFEHTTNTLQLLTGIAFQNLRNSNQLFILHKDSVPTLEIGKVTNVSVPVPKYGNPGMYNQEMIVDITADINGTSANFQKLPAMGDIADFGNNIVVSCNKEAMNSEVSSMKQRSLDIINSIETHQSIIKGCDEILSQLNPEIVEKQRQEQENKALREEINSLKEMFKEFINTSLKQEKHGNNN